MSDEFKNACTLFREIDDYSEYIEKDGCTFKGHFTCPGINNTIMETFARDQCNTPDVSLPLFDELVLRFCFLFLLLAIIYIFRYANNM
jgi:hypothetical protein